MGKTAVFVLASLQQLDDEAGSKEEVKVKKDGKEVTVNKNKLAVVVRKIL
jgi:hypothetical protein